MMRAAAVSLFAIALAVSMAPAKEKKTIPRPEFFPSPAAAMRTLPFSEAVRVGDMLYLAGQIGTKPGTRELAPGGIAGETRQVLENIKAVLERRGSSLDRVVKCTVFLADIGEWQAMNEVYITFFPKDPPARSALGASGLAYGARVEIECLAVAGGPAAG
jgi:2-iminobutanoate/2-iminopropanoate deaminase